MGMHPVQVIAVTGGKGGVGKTNVSVNLALALADLGRRVMLMDADLGLANVDVLLGLSAKRTLEDVISGECELRDVLLQGPGGIRIVPAASGIQSMVQLSPMQHAGLIQAFSDISDNLDVLIIDTAAGIGDGVVSFVRAAQEVLVVVCDEPTSITDAYALIKLLNRDHGMNRFRVLANMATSTCCWASAPNAPWKTSSVASASCAMCYCRALAAFVSCRQPRVFRAWCSCHPCNMRGLSRRSAISVTTSTC